MFALYLNPLHYTGPRVQEVQGYVQCLELTTDIFNNTLINERDTMKRKTET